MKALSIRQPWAHFIIHGFFPLGHKDIENRKWSTKFRGEFLVHAGQLADHKACQYYNVNPRDFVTGGIIGKVNLVQVVNESASPWWQGPIGFVLKDPVALDFRPYKGKLNFFEVEDM